jgi:branched-chain amino acid transport system ATP-binding protein
MTTERLLDARGLVAGYGGIPVVHGVDLHVGAGEVVALLGANGAGKTTTLLTVSGVLPLIGGSVSVLGEEQPMRRRARPGEVAARARRGVAHVPEDRGLFFDLTTAENLRLGRPRGRGAPDPLPMEQILEWFPALRDVMGRRAGLLSGGEQQMVALARAVLGRPRLLMVDEMSLGLAPIIVDHLLPVLRSIAQELGAGVLLVEQHVALVLAVSDRAYLMDRGTIVASGPAAELAGRSDLIESGYLGTAADAPEPDGPGQVNDVKSDPSHVDTSDADRGN